MKKKIVLIILIFIFFLSACDRIEKSQTLHNNSSESMSLPDYEYSQEILGEIVWDNDTEGFSRLIRNGANRYADEVKGEFQAVVDDKSAFPEELVYMLERSLYHSCNYSNVIWKSDEREGNAYYELIRELGEDEYRLSLEMLYELFPELYEHKEDFLNEYDAYKFLSGAENCINMFYIPVKEENDNYVFVYDWGGTEKTCYIEVTQYTGREFNVLASFDVQKSGDVICYEGEFYYICQPYNFIIGAYDGILIYKLNASQEGESLLIEYRPEEYMWENIYINDVSVSPEFAEELEIYLESIKGEITCDKYLENGDGKDDIGLFFGEEVEDDSFILKNEPKGHYNNTYYKIDFANLGVPIYMWKSNMLPSGGLGRWHLIMKFYLFDEETGLTKELENLEIGENGFNQYSMIPVQMWFKEIDGKIVTFRVYHISNYNYLLNVVLVEGNKIIQLRNDIFAPKRSFVLTKGSIN